MDFSDYIENKYADKLELSETNAGSSIPAVEKNTPEPAKVDPEIIELNETTKKDFFDFDVEKTFIGIFNGPGAVYQYNGQNPFKINTWSFTDHNNLNWVIPAWAVLNVPQDNFMGFANEEPGKNKYQITYLGNDGGKHDIAIFKKPIHN
jgi:hypothetical protein